MRAFAYAYFSLVFHPPSTRSVTGDSQDLSEPDGHISEKTLQVDEVFQSLTNLDTSKASGPTVFHLDFCKCVASKSHQAFVNRSTILHIPVIFDLSGNRQMSLTFITRNVKSWLRIIDQFRCCPSLAKFCNVVCALDFIQMETFVEKH